MKARLFWIWICVIVFIPQKAEAYLDPGTGSMIVQSIIASIAAIGCVVAAFMDKIAGFFKKDKNDTKK